MKHNYIEILHIFYLSPHSKLTASYRMSHDHKLINVFVKIAELKFCLQISLSCAGSALDE